MTPRQCHRRYRDLLIAAGHRYGMTERQLADALGLTPARIHAIIEEVKASLPENSERSENFYPPMLPGFPDVEAFK